MNLRSRGDLNQWHCLRRERVMPDATIKRLDQMESFYDGLVLRARASLGVSSWGMQIFNLPPNFDEYPEHHHGEGAVDPGQEEVYIPLEGSATLFLGDENGDLVIRPEQIGRRLDPLHRITRRTVLRSRGCAQEPKAGH